jgi:hypothetical protein
MKISRDAEPPPKGDIHCLPLLFNRGGTGLSPALPDIAPEPPPAERRIKRALDEETIE